jgi:hypothetical protein
MGCFREASWFRASRSKVPLSNTSCEWSEPPLIRPAVIRPADFPVLRFRPVGPALPARGMHITNIDRLDSTCRVFALSQIIRLLTNIVTREEH